MHIHAEHNGVKFNCTICFKEFKRKGSLDRHMTGVHKTVSTNSRYVDLKIVCSSKQLLKMSLK